MAYDIKDMQEIARLYKGKCLSKEYIDLYTPLEWMCARGHTWDAPYTIIQQGGWCRQCLKEEEKQRSLEECKLFAEKKGGKCISPVYVNCDHKLKWQCAEGHTWETIPSRAKKTWCPQCARNKIIMNLLKRMEREHGFTIASKYYNNSTPVKWNCKEGHIFQSTYHNLQNGNGCTECNREKRLNEIKGYVKELNRIAIKHGGRMLTKKYINNYTKIEWECSKGHRWKADGGRIKLGSWCPKCYRISQKNTIEEMQKLAKQHRGKCLSDEYFNCYTKLKWQCRFGHIWETVPSVIVMGAWCPECSGVKRLTIFDMQSVAKSRGGKCLSKKIINAHLKLKWQCRMGHEWEAVASSVKAGKWCPFCAGTARSTISQAKTAAKKMKGKCLSATYINSSTNLKWQCSKGHTWMATLNSVKNRGTWCPVCAVEKNSGVINLYNRWKKENSV